MPGEVIFVFTSREVRHYNQDAFVLASRIAEDTDFASPATAIEEFKTFLRDGYDACSELPACNTRRHLTAYSVLLITSCRDCPV